MQEEGTGEVAAGFDDVDARADRRVGGAADGAVDVLDAGGDVDT